MYLPTPRLRNATSIPNALTWSDNLESVALTRAKDLRDHCSLSHLNNWMYGENLAMGNGSDMNSTVAARFINLWIQEGYTPGQYSHWTQMDWSGSQWLGCAMAVGDPLVGCPYVFFACEYDPPGNVQGRTPWTDVSFPPPFPSIPIYFPNQTSLPDNAFPLPLSPPPISPSFPVHWPQPPPESWKRPFVHYPKPLPSDRFIQALTIAYYKFKQLLTLTNPPTSLASLGGSVPTIMVDPAAQYLGQVFSHASMKFWISPSLFVFIYFVSTYLV
ncbi:hypothetical protein HMI54_012531 [Coelomomyces lativittatus]|nr:hypothetical protein HMI54_012531 [Coelomomyces lativittatus]